jgi:hypothetical protein
VPAWLRPHGRRPRRWEAAAGGYTWAVIAFYSRRLGCLGSLVLSILLTACLIALFLLL